MLLLGEAGDSLIRPMFTFWKEKSWDSLIRPIFLLGMTPNLINMERQAVLFFRPVCFTTPDEAFFT
jgi:hypothetical protein